MPKDGTAIAVARGVGFLLQVEGGPGLATGDEVDRLLAIQIEVRARGSAVDGIGMAVELFEQRTSPIETQRRDVIGQLATRDAEVLVVGVAFK